MTCDGRPTRVGPAWPRGVLLICAVLAGGVAAAQVADAEALDLARAALHRRELSRAAQALARIPPDAPLDIRAPAELLRGNLAWWQRDFAAALEHYRLAEKDWQAVDRTQPGRAAGPLAVLAESQAMTRADLARREDLAGRVTSLRSLVWAAILLSVLASFCAARYWPARGAGSTHV